MNASAKQIRTALFTALKALERDATHQTRPFAYVGHYRGEVTRTHGPDIESFSHATAALLVEEGEVPFDPGEVRTLTKGPAERVGSSVWRVYVVLQDPGGATAEVTTAPGQPSIDDLNDAVIAALEGLFITGLWRSEKVRMVDKRPHLVTETSTTYVLRFSVARILPRVAPRPKPGVPMEGMQGGVHLENEHDTPPSPLVSFKSDTT